MTRSSGLALPGRVCKVDRVALSDSRGIPIGPYTGPSDPPVSPRNPTWEPHTQVEGLWAETPLPTWLTLASLCTDVRELACALHAAKRLCLLDPPSFSSARPPTPTPSITPSVLTARPAPTPWEAASTSAASVCSSLARSGSPGQRCALCTPAAWFASWQEARQSPCFLHNLSLGRAWGGAPISFS